MLLSAAAVQDMEAETRVAGFGSKNAAFQWSGLTFLRSQISLIPIG
jgi:hypothetical protein